MARAGAGLQGDPRALSRLSDRGKDFQYEYTDDVLAIDVINGGPDLRLWVDDAAAAPGDLDALALPDEWRGVTRLRIC